jgi:hypothetical protein
MAEITQQMVEKSYEIAKKVYKAELSKNAGAKILNEKYEMNKYSAIIYISDINYYDRYVSSNVDKLYKEILELIKTETGK